MSETDRTNEPAGSLGFPATARIRKKGEFDRIFAQKLSAGDHQVIVHGMPSETGSPRLGLVVSRRVGGAVRRNRWKRQLREAFRLTRRDLPPYDLLCIPRPAAEPDLEGLKRSLIQLAWRIARRRLKSEASRGATENTVAAPQEQPTEEQGP